MNEHTHMQTYTHTHTHTHMERMFVSYYFPVTVCLGMWTLIGRCHTIIGSTWELENFDGSKSIQHSYTVALLFYHFYLWIKKCHLLQFSSVQSLSHVWLFVIPRTAACQASLSIRSSQSWLKVVSIERVMPSNHLTLYHPLLPPSIFPSIRVLSNESVLHIRWPSIGDSASASVLPMNIQTDYL